jgi:hypothetical protein
VLESTLWTFVDKLPKFHFHVSALCSELVGKYLGGCTISNKEHLSFLKGT